jgi:hypothetical protein
MYNIFHQKENESYATGLHTPPKKVIDFNDLSPFNTISSIPEFYFDNLISTPKENILMSS